MRFLVTAGALARSEVPFGWLLADAPRSRADRHTPRGGTVDGLQFTQDFHGGETIIRAGTPIAQDASEPVCTPYDDCVLG